MIEIFTDGSCRNNQGANNTGGWGLSVFIDGKLSFIDGKQSCNTTNNREEFKAIIAAVNLAQDTFKGEKVTIYSDSAYCLNTITNWMYSWYKKGWKKADKKEPENLDQVQKLYDKLLFESNITFVKVPGHAGLMGNEISDAIATDDEKKLEKYICILTQEGLINSGFVLDFDFNINL